MKELKLSNQLWSDASDWESAGIRLPAFSRPQMVQKTLITPQWIHFGAGNIFRSFLASLQQLLLDRGLTETGVIAAEAFDGAILDTVYRPYDNLSLVVLMAPDGSLFNSVNAAVADSVSVGENDGEWRRLVEMAETPSLQMISFTITEKGYGLTSPQGEYLPVVQEDIQNGPARPKTMMGIAASLLFSRFRAGGTPLALVSMDNCSHNGEKLQQSVCKIAGEWKARGFVPQEFTEFLNDPEKVSFPWTMIDKITPRPSEKVAEKLRGIGFADTEIFVTEKHSCVAPFVNAEIPQYLIIEDRFPNGRPPLEEAGVIFTDRETVNQSERMKVCTCLNPLHTALAVFGCLLGYRSIASEMEDPFLRTLVETIGKKEGMPVVEDPKILNPAEFLREVVEQRLPNPYIPDTPQRIACDTSQKMAIRFGNTIRAYCERSELDPADLVGIPLAIAGWLRYLMGIDDTGAPMEISPDPLLPYLQKELSGVTLGEPNSVGNHLSALLQNRQIFGVDLTEAGLSGKITDYFTEMIAGNGSVGTTLGKHLPADKA